MHFKAVIFDFNGVLLWDTELHEQAWKAYSEELRGYALTNEEMKTHVHGRPNSAIFEYLIGRKLNAEELEQHTQGKESAYRDLCLGLGSDFVLSPGAIQLLDFLKDQAIPHTIATASEITNLRFFFEHLHLDKWFRFEDVVYDDGTFPGKPAPDIYLKAAEKLGFSTKDCIVIEDSRSGMKAAHAADIGYIIALGPVASHTELKTLPGVNVAIAQLDEILSMELFG